MHLKRPIILLILAFLLQTFASKGQKNIDHQQLLWLRYNLKVQLNTKYQIRQEIEERTYWFPLRQHQFISRTLVERKLAKGWNAATGLTCFLQAWPQEPNKREYENVTELRPQVELAYTQTFTEKWSLHHRYWAELRFFEQIDGSFAFSNTRVRYKLELSYAPSSKITLRAFNEIFINAGNNIVLNVFDQNRVGGSIQYLMFKNFGVELGYFNWFQQRPSGLDFYSRDIVRFSILHTLDFRKAKS